MKIKTFHFSKKKSKCDFKKYLFVRHKKFTLFIKLLKDIKKAKKSNDHG